MSKETNITKIPSEAECLVLIKENNLKHLTILYLECWQRLYDRRPYENFILTRHQFERNMERSFHEDDFDVILKFLEQNHSRLKTVQIFYISLDLKFFKLEQFIRFTLNLVELNLTGVNLSVTFIKLLSYKWLESNIKRLNLSGNELNKCHLQYLRYFLIRNEELESLNVGYCDIREINFPIVADGIYNSKSLKSLNITNIIKVFQPNHSDKVMLTLGSLLMKNQLTEINLNHCCFDFSYIEYISEYLAHPGTKLKRLFLGRNNIGPDGVKMIFGAIAKTKVLNVLDISANRIKDLGGHTIGRMLPSTMLTYLNIKDNHLSAEAMFFILCNMKKPLLLEELKISGNTFDTKCARVIRRIIDSHTMNVESFDVKIYERDNEPFVFDVIQNDNLIPDEKLVSENAFQVKKKYLNPLLGNVRCCGKIVDLAD